MLEKGKTNKLKNIFLVIRMENSYEEKYDVIVQDMSNSEDKPADGIINKNTGEINWDCPCLKSALEPPCGEYFKAAFSCFAESTTKPKGEDCVDLFVALQSCYIAHPEIYKPKEDIDTEDEIQEIPTAANVPASD